MSVRCVRCGKRLRVPKSVTRGMGPVCFRKVKAEVGKRGGEVLEEDGACFVRYPKGRSFRIVEIQLELFEAKEGKGG